MIHYEINEGTIELTFGRESVQTMCSEVSSSCACMMSAVYEKLLEHSYSPEKAEDILRTMFSAAIADTLGSIRDRRYSIADVTISVPDDTMD